MRHIYKALLKGAVLPMLVLGLYSCEDYLDKEPDSIVAEGEAFKNFTNFQGFIEEIYNCIPDKEKCYWTTSWNWGDDELFNFDGSWHMTNQVDIGNFWAWQEGPATWLDKSNARSNIYQ
jgi:starch-binding outer membrane protein, SusD/RagB family